MYKKVINVQNAKKVGDFGLRVGKDIVYEGTKMVLWKTVRGVGANAIEAKGFKNMKNLTLDDVLQDNTRREEKRVKKIEKMKKREIKLAKKQEAVVEFNATIKEAKE